MVGIQPSEEVAGVNIWRRNEPGHLPPFAVSFIVN